MNTITNRTWKKIAAFAMSLTIMCGVGAVMGRTTGATFVTSAAEEQVTEDFEIQPCEHGTLHAELIQSTDQEFDAILVTPEPDAGYKVAAVYAGGDQVAINDKDQYLIAYNGEKIILSAEFVKADSSTDSSPKTGAAAAGIGMTAAAAIAAAALIATKKRK